VISKGWAEIIRKVYETDPLLCPSCGCFIDSRAESILKLLVNLLALIFRWICFAFCVFDLVVLTVIILFQDVSGWRLRIIVRDLELGKKEFLISE
jgi:hypothetical protein